MKKFIALLLALTVVFAMAACTTTPNDPTVDIHAKAEGTMTHAEYAAAADDDAVVIEAFVQAKQGWWEQDGQGKATIYLQDQDGGYLAYNLFCTKAEYDQMVIGAKMKISGYKTSYKGEQEIDGESTTFEILEGNWVAPATDVTAELASEDVIKYQNMFVSIKGAKVVASTNANGEEHAFLYNWDGSGSAGSDLYFNIEVNGKVYNMCVESYLTGDGTAAYDAVEALAIGDTIDLEGFLYWYDGVNPHITGVTKK
jgi:hypothetical protein